MENLLEIKTLNTYYGESHILRDVDLNVKSGENTVVVIDHDMEFIRRLDSNVSVLNQGTVLCEGTMETIQKDKKVIDVYLGRPED